MAFVPLSLSSISVMRQKQNSSISASEKGWKKCSITGITSEPCDPSGRDETSSVLGSFEKRECHKALHTDGEQKLFLWR